MRAPSSQLANFCQSVGKEVFLNSLCKCHQHSTPLPSVNGFVGSPGGSSLGKIIPPKSPPPPPLPPPVNTGVPASQKTDLRVVIPQSKGIALVSVLTAVSKQIRSCHIITTHYIIKITIKYRLFSLGV